MLRWATGLLELNRDKVVSLTLEIEGGGLKEGPFLGLLFVFEDELHLITSENKVLGLVGLTEDKEDYYY